MMKDLYKRMEGLEKKVTEQTPWRKQNQKAITTLEALWVSPKNHRD